MSATYSRTAALDRSFGSSVGSRSSLSEVVFHRWRISNTPSSTSACTSRTSDRICLIFASISSVWNADFQNSAPGPGLPPAPPSVSKRRARPPESH